MKKLEKTAGILFLLGIIQIFFHLPLGNLFLNISTIIIVVLYLLLGFAYFNDINFKSIFKFEYLDYHSPISKRRLKFSAYSGLGLTTIAIGIFFKIKHYPGASVILILGFIMVLALFIALYLKKKENKDLFFKTIANRFAILSIIGIVFMTTNLELTSLKYNFPNNPELIRSYVKMSKNPNDEINVQEFRSLYRKAVAEKQRDN
ncbi:GldL-related protein [Carboxylicivirga linearis]|uniref:Uncharacterized protein n=1 Tax=Carboxylicivirga linearis TaxID=1628157 RepID=A0ABS5JXF9_9BACT|nr:hypothetical protein [Carboxylicivirga linearis]MBS2099514.1 hypothetical protein [Carboxylicivirga linearis]